MRDLSPINNLHNELAEMGQREARQRRIVAEAAETQLARATDAVESIIQEIEYFETQLKPNEEARLVIIGGPAGTAIFPNSLTAQGSDRIRFTGVDNDQCRVTVIQHISQLNVMLKAVVVNGVEQARRIGFHSNVDDEL